MILKTFQLIAIAFFTMSTGGIARVSADVQNPTISLEQSVHFLTPNGDNVVVQAGTYDIEAAEDWLRLIPQGHSRVEGILLQTNVSQLDGLLNRPQAVSQQVGKDQHRLTLLLPDGTKFEAEGSYSGVRSRGRLSRKGLMTTRPILKNPKTLVPLAKPVVPQKVPPRITAVKGPDSNLVEQLLATVNCGDSKATGMSASHCQRIKADLRKRLKGYRVLGNGIPNQRVNLYLAQGCPAAEDFRKRVDQEVASSVRNQLRLTDGKLASRISSLFNQYWQRLSNVVIGNRGAFQSVLIAPKNSLGVNIAAPAGSLCSPRVSLPQPTVPVDTPTPNSTLPPGSDQPIEAPPSTTPPPETAPPANSTPLSVSESDFLAQHNAVRANVAPAPTTPLPSLTWNQAIANVAQDWANQCILGHNTQKGALGENVFITSIQANNLAQQAVHAWASEATQYDYASHTCASGQTCGHYTQLVWETTTELGCGAASCPAMQNYGGGQATFTVCNYSPSQGNFFTQRPYQLVVAAELPSGTTSPANATPPPEPATFPDLQSAFLGYHNAVRSSVIPNPTTPLPSLTWNQEIANVAQDWANQCVLGHNAEKGPVGENLFITSVTSGDIAHQAVQAWVSEAPHYDLTSVTCAPGKICGHYTQVVWEQTTQLGCAIASCPAVENYGGGPATIAVCDYSPSQGNFFNQPAYDLN